MKILIASDAFKGSLSPVEATKAMASAAKRIFPEARVVQIPLSDGGAGALDCVKFSVPGARLHKTSVTGPLGQKVPASVAVFPDGRTFFIESAQACGLKHVKGKPDIFRATTRGVGELILFALNRGAKKIIVALGGSATNDGGAGALSALGVRFLDSQERLLPDGGSSLIRLSQIDFLKSDPRLKSVRLLIASDVKNPLLGLRGASFTYAPQKGASPEQSILLEKSLCRFSSIAEKTTHKKIAGKPGAGAAGGLGFGLMLAGGEIISGFSYMAGLTRLEGQLKRSSFALTGEGKLDAQTGYGKTISGLALLCRKHRVPLLAFAGILDGTPRQFKRLGLSACFSIVPGPVDGKKAMQKASVFLEHTAESVLSLLKTGGELTKIKHL